MPRSPVASPSPPPAGRRRAGGLGTGEAADATNLADFPTGGIICGKNSIWKGYETGRSTIIVRSKTTIDERKPGRMRIIVNDIPYQQTRDPVIKKIAELANEGKVPGISGVRDESDLKEPVRIVIDLKKDADPEIVLNQLYKFSPLQDTFSIILLALVDGKPRTLSLKEMLQEFVRHRVIVIRRRTQFLLSRARKRKHTVQGLLLAHANIDEVIRVIRASKTQAEAKERLMQIKTPAALMKRAFGDEGFAQFQQERGVAEEYSLTPVQAEAILKMTLGQLVNLEQEKLADEHAKLMIEIGEYLAILADEKKIYAIIREDCLEVARKHADKRRTEISGEEIGEVNLEDLIEEEQMVVSISHNGYIKRTPSSVYRSQRRGGKGIKGAEADDDDPVEHLFVTSTHDYLLFFTSKGKVYWEKVYNLPALRRESKGRAVVNLLNLAEDEKIADCRAVRDFDRPDHYLMMATRGGLVKKTELKAYSRPLKSGIIAIKLREDDELVDVAITQKGDELILATATGMAIRFRESDARCVRPIARVAEGWILPQRPSRGPGSGVAGKSRATGEGRKSCAAQAGLRDGQSQSQKARRRRRPRGARHRQRRRSAALLHPGLRRASSDGVDGGGGSEPDAGDPVILTMGR